MRHVFGLLSFAGLATHIFNCLDTDRIWFLIWATLLLPVGVWHGWYLWYLAISHYITGV